MRRKISILLVLLLLCAFLNGCSGEKSISKVELPAVVPESPAQESVAPESTAQDLPEQNNSAPSQADASPYNYGNLSVHDLEILLAAAVRRTAL